MKPTLNLSRRGRRVPAPPPPPTSPPADRSALPERLPIPSSFVDDLLCRLQQDEQEEEEEDDDDDIDTSNDDDGAMTKSPAPPSTSQQQQDTMVQDNGHSSPDTQYFALIRPCSECRI